jgi:SAM-dependent methyltransferase
MPDSKSSAPHRPHSGGAGEPSAWVAAFLRRDSARRLETVLDVACGGGRHLRLARARGFDVIGIDRDLSGVRDLEGAAGCALIEADLEDGAVWPLGSRRFDAVVVTNYLWRARLSDIVAAVADDGVLIYETFGAGQSRHGRPTNPDFLLRPGELLEAVRGQLVPLAYENVTLDQPVRIVQRILAAGPGHRWADDPPSLL